MSREEILELLTDAGFSERVANEIAESATVEESETDLLERAALLETPLAVATGPDRRRGVGEGAGGGSGGSTSDLGELFGGQIGERLGDLRTQTLGRAITGEDTYGIDPRALITNEDLHDAFFAEQDLFGAGAEMREEVGRLIREAGGIDAADLRVGTPVLTGADAKFDRSADEGILRETKGMSVRDIKIWFRALTEAEIMQVQFQLFEAGLFEEFGELPAWGIADDVSTEIIGLLSYEAAFLHPGTSLAQVLKIKQREESQRRTALVSQELADAREALPRLMNEDEAKDLVAQLGTAMFGRHASAEALERGFAAFRSAEEERIRMDPAFDRFQSAMAGAEAGVGTDSLTRFMNALVGQESGGNPNAVNSRTAAMGLFQILPSNYPSWAAEAGVDPNDRSPEAQWKVARNKLLQYLAITGGDYARVAQMWYAGPGVLSFSPEALSRRQGPTGAEPSIIEYTQRVMGRFNRLVGSPEGAMSPQFFDEDAPSPQFAAEQALRQADPQTFYEHQLNQRADEFFALLGPAGGLIGDGSRG